MPVAGESPTSRLSLRFRRVLLGLFPIRVKFAKLWNYFSVPHLFFFVSTHDFARIFYPLTSTFRHYALLWRLPAFVDLDQDSLLHLAVTGTRARPLPSLFGKVPDVDLFLTFPPPLVLRSPVIESTAAPLNVSVLLHYRSS